MTVAIYCRLSKEDDAKTQESESIQNQKSLLIHYSFEKGWDIYNIYCDDDFRGCDRSRPAFNQMIQEAKQGAFQLVNENWRRNGFLFHAPIIGEKVNRFRGSILSRPQRFPASALRPI